MSQLITRIRNYINQKYLIRYVDNPHWQLVDDHSGKVTTLLHEEMTGELKTYFPQVDVEKEKLTDPVNYKFLLHKVTRYIFKISDCIVEPDYNWVILGDKEIFRFSYPMIEDPWDSVKPRPSVIGNYLHKKPLVVEKAILVKYLWENYYHFFVDTLAQVYLCDQQGIAADVPVIVPHHFAKYAYIANFLMAFPLKRKIIIQEKGQYIHVKELYVAKDIMTNDHFPAIRQKVIASDLAASEPAIESPELLFVTRKKGIRRSITNIDELEAIATQYGFTIVEPGNYTWKQQVKLFSAARRIIGVHGAGLTNILFCKNDDVRIFEIFPGNGLHPEHYELMAKKQGFGYSSVEGNGLDSNSQFAVDKELFAEGVKRLMA